MRVYGSANSSASNIATWTFRKAPSRFEKERGEMAGKTAPHTFPQSCESSLRTICANGGYTKGPRRVVRKKKRRREEGEKGGENPAPHTFPQSCESSLRTICANGGYTK